MTTLRELRALLRYERDRLTCELIERLRPGAGHSWLPRTEPATCRHCGTTRQ